MKYGKLIAIGLFFMALAGCSGNSHSTDQHLVEYEVSTYSANPVSITYINEHGDSVNLPSKNVTNKSWTYSFYARTGTYLYLSATLLGDSTDIFNATIYVDGIHMYTMSQKGGTPAVVELTLADDLN